MFLRFRKTWSVIFVILLFTLLLITIETYTKQTLEEVSKGNDVRKYISQDLNECLGIQALCVPGRIFFSDETGCGCELIEEESKKVNCEESQRNTDFCIEIYQPVCGWNDLGKFSSSETFSNSCFACQNEDILYYIQGECLTN